MCGCLCLRTGRAPQSVARSRRAIRSGQGREDPSFALRERRQSTAALRSDHPETAPAFDDQDHHELTAEDLAERPSRATHFAAGVLASETFWFAVFRSMQPLVSVYEYVPSSSRQNSPWKGQ